MELGVLEFRRNACYIVVWYIRVTLTYDLICTECVILEFRHGPCLFACGRVFCCVQTSGRCEEQQGEASSSARSIRFSHFELFVALEAKGSN